MTISELKTLMESGEFHHATDRQAGKCHDGLYIYVKDDSPRGFRGFRLAGAFSSYDNASREDYRAACQLVRYTGYSVGSYGNG